MRELLDELMRRWDAGTPVALATVVAAARSAPLPLGTSMFVDADGVVVGGVSGGCVEADLYAVAKEVLASGEPTPRSYRVADEFNVGLPCGGQLDVFVQRVDRASFAQLGAVAEAVRAQVPVAVATCIAGGHVGARMVVWPDRFQGSLLGAGPGAADPGSPSAGSDEGIADDVRRLLRQGQTGIRGYGGGGRLSVFVASLRPAPRMIIFGANSFGAALAEMGHLLGYRVSLCDARSVFATQARAPAAMEVVVERPELYLRGQAEAGLLDERTAVCVLVHDAKFDAAILAVALGLPVAYVGAMGSRQAHRDRLVRLAELGVTDEQLMRLHAPIGLDIGGHTPAETAVSIAAEVVAARTGATGKSLRTTAGRLHASPAALGPPSGR